MLDLEKLNDNDVFDDDEIELEDELKDAKSN